MAIISFWNNGKDGIGKSSAIAAISTFLGINYNYKILVIDTGYNDYFYKDCFWRENKKEKDNRFTDIGEGIKGISRAVLSNKISPEIVTNYTKIVFNGNRLEILMDTNLMREEYDMCKNIFNDIIKISNKYYDLVFVDLDNDLDVGIVDSILDSSSIIMACLPQKIREIDEYIEIRESKSVLRGKTIIPIIGRYDKHSKYNTKNVAKYIKEKRGVCAIPYNTLFFEACNEGKVADFFIKFRKINEKDRNAMFISEVRQSAENMIARLQELQKRM